ncbi:DNA helicase [Salvia divinorum]|uniref:DNA helicase n=1 Tax=Salvia divinorum TaxID=28513 RepID=A0ABD1IG08_SALDI
MRYMLKLEVFDGTSTAELILWDKECAHIMQKKASEVNGAEVISANIVPKEIEQCIAGKNFLFKIVLRNEDEFLSMKSYNVKKVVTDVDIIKKHSANLLSNLEASKKALSYEDMFLEECNNLSQIVEEVMRTL